LPVQFLYGYFALPVYEIQPKWYWRTGIDLLLFNA
jgi:hypothetical protein